MNAPESLRKIIKKRLGGNVAAAAAEIGVPQSALHYWLKGASRPRSRGREAIERWTQGKVPASAWDSAA